MGAIPAGTLAEPVSPSLPSPRGGGSLKNNLLRNYVDAFARLGWALGLWWAGTLGSAAAEVDEYQVKAVFLYNFAQFVSWPETSLHDPASAFRVCVLGVNPFGKRLGHAINGETLRGHPLTVEYLSLRATPEGCHSLFVSGLEPPRLAHVLRHVAGKPVLTVSDAEGFIEAGGMIQLYLSPDSRMRFKIMPTRLQSVGLRADANLLRVGEVVPE